MLRVKLNCAPPQLAQSMLPVELLVQVPAQLEPTRAALGALGEADRRCPRVAASARIVSLALRARLLRPVYRM